MGDKSVTGDFRAVYRVITDDQATAQGPQFILRKKVRFGEEKRWSINGSAEFNLFWFSRDLKSGQLPQDFLFPGTRSTVVGSKLYTDIVNGTQSTHNLFASQNIFEIFFLYQPFKNIPFEFGLRAGFLAYWTKIETTSVAMGGAKPAEHLGKNKCIPGDIYCQKAPIPAPSGVPQFYSQKETSSEWSFAPRFGPHAVLKLALPSNPNITINIGVEHLISGRGNQEHPFDHVFRAWVEPTVRINRWLTIFAEPRYSAIWSQGSFRNRFDCSIGPKANW